MRYNDTVDDSRQYLRYSLEMIGKYGLPTDPLNYCIWYEYASGKNQALNAAIDNHLKRSGAFTEDTCLHFFNQYIADDNQKVSAKVQERLQLVLVEIINAIQMTKQHFSQSENKLHALDQSLLPSLTGEDLEKIVEKLKHEIKSLESSSGSFKEQLDEAKREIDILKNQLSQYRQEALVDPLTRVLNRRGFENSLEEKVDQAKAAKTSLCIILADIDHFKRVNDTHGHLVGDNVLRMVAATIKESIKGKDLAARIGGEEFAILLPNTPFNGAMKLADNIRVAFENLEIKKKSTGESLGKITLSFGVSTFKETESGEDFMNRADEALYRSKNSGRNKVTGL